MKKLEKYWLVLVKYYLNLSALVRYCTGPNQTNRKNRHRNNNKLILKIPLVLTLCRWGFSTLIKV